MTLRGLEWKWGKNKERRKRKKVVFQPGWSSTVDSTVRALCWTATRALAVCHERIDVI